MNTGPTLKKSSEIINNIYDNLSYFDLYGTSLFVFFIVTAFVFLVFSYCKVMLNAQDIKDDWNNRRCDPQVMPFAGYINAPEGTTATDFTSDNFSYCIQNVLADASEEALQPLNSLTDGLTDLYTSLLDSINAIRGALSKLRDRIAAIIAEILGKILNIVTPIQVMFIAFADTMRKTQAMLATALYTILGVYYVLQASMGAAIQGVITILIVMVGVIAALWIMPFTFPAAAISTTIFLAISIPLAVITAIVSKSLHITTAGIPGLCFDKHTLVEMRGNKFKPIYKIKLGDVLEDGGIVTGRMTLFRCSEKMYVLNNVTVSGTHTVKYNKKWIKVCTHPDAVVVKEYIEPYLYCLNTSTKIINVNGTVFTDWDELYEDDLVKISGLSEETSLDGGFDKETDVELINLSTVKIKDLVPGSILKNGEVALGVVEVDSCVKYQYCLGDSVAFSGDNINMKSFNKEVNNDGLVYKKMVHKSKTKEEMTGKDVESMYHLITNTGTFSIGDITVYDYNSLIDKHLKPWIFRIME